MVPHYHYRNYLVVGQKLAPGHTRVSQWPHPPEAAPVTHGGLWGVERWRGAQANGLPKLSSFCTVYFFINSNGPNPPLLDVCRQAPGPKQAELGGSISAAKR